jgi:ketosteroid isomerase-like protein
MEAEMTWRSTTWAIASLALLGAGGAAAQGPNVTERDIQRLLDESAASWNRGDLDGHLADNADSISFMTRKGPIVGKERTAEALRRSFFKDGKPMQQLRFEQVSIRRLGREHALVVGRFVLEGGGQPEQSGWFSTVWERQADGWRVIHDHSS